MSLILSLNYLGVYNITLLEIQAANDALAYMTVSIGSTRLLMTPRRNATLGS